MSIRFALPLALALSPVPAFAQTPAPTAPPPPPKAVPDQADVAYGPHPENRLDFFKAAGDGPRPLIVFIHGGGWRGGKKDLQPNQVAPYLEKGVSVASVTYRFTPANPLPAPVHDAARAIQFLRSRADEWNIDRARVAAIGGSAGACTSMWLLFHDDLADPKAADPVLRDSTRLVAAVGLAGQTSIDPKVIEPWLGPNVLKHSMIPNAVGEPTIAEALARYDQHAALYREFSPINHVSAGDPPLFMAYSADRSLPSKDAGHGIHHPAYGEKMKAACDAAGVECHLLIPGSAKPEAFANPTEFLLAKLLK